MGSLKHRKFIKLAVLTGGVILTFEGCAFLTHRQQITALKRLGDEQQKLEGYVSQQEDLFYKLKSDIQKEGLVKGTSKTKILSHYGGPIYCKRTGDNIGAQESCLYRHPTRFFSSDRIYLKFDNNQNLYSWELEPAF
jgi:hypothetical protein